MNRMMFFAAVLGLASTCKAQGIGNAAEVAVIDRDTGAVLSPHYYRGEYWVAGKPGSRYAIEIRNRLGERLLAVTSVDGVNVVSGENASWEQTGYVFSAGQRYQITGWRKSDAEVAAFTFTESPNSYAERTGRPANVGVIGVAIFRERQPEPTYVPPMIGRLSAGSPRAPNAYDSARGSAAESASNSAVGSAAPGDGKALAGLPAAPAAQSMAVPRAAVPAAKLGTGHGEREYSYVNRTEFSRMQTQPNEVIRIRYDSFDNLLAMGIVKRPRPVAPTMNPFPASPEQQYVPDPPG
jgi:hypothetical protein